MFNMAPNIEDGMKYALGEISDSPEREESDAAWVGFVHSEYDTRLGLTELDRRSEEENHGIYTGLNFGQWPEAVRSETKKDLSQFNFVAKAINSVTGHFLRNWWDVDYESVGGENSDDITIIKELFYFDKDIGDWMEEFRKFIKNGVIRSGDLMMTVDYSHNPDFGNIAIKTMMPGTVLWDTNWTDDNSKTAKNCFASTYRTPKELIRMFPEKKERIDTMVRLKAFEESDEAVNSVGGSIPRFDLREQYNNTYLVIDYYYMSPKETKRKFGLSNGKDWVDVPSEAGEAWYEVNKVDADTVIEQTVVEDICYVTTIVPELDLSEAMQDKPTLLQLGRLPFFRWSYNSHLGKNVGLMDWLKDPQRYTNEMFSLIHTMIQNTRRTKIIDPEAFGDHENLDELKEKILRGDEAVFTEPGASKEFPNIIQEGSPSSPLGQEMNFAQMVMNSTDKITTTNAAMSGEGGSERSALHFDLKREQGEIGMTMQQEGLRAVLKEIAEAYFHASKSLYGGMYRSFESPHANIEINVEMDDGRVINDITNIPRGKVIVTDSPAALSRKTNDRVMATQILSTLGDSDVAARTVALKAIFKSLETFNEAEKEEIANSLDLSRDVGLKNMALQNSNIELQLLQTETMKQQMLNPQTANPSEDGQGGDAQGGDGHGGREATPQMMDELQVRQQQMQR